MIGRLVGAIVSEELDGTLLVDVGGVGYEVRAPLATAQRVQAERDGRVVLHVHTHVREDAIELYGFASALERAVFRLLIEVPNVGPKTGLGVLSSLPPPDLARAVQMKDIGRLNKISGVGKKTAERLVLELHEKLPKLSGIDAAAPGVPVAAPADADRLVSALTNMGYRPAEAERAVRAMASRIGHEPLGALIKDALAELSR